MGTAQWSLEYVASAVSGSLFDFINTFCPTSRIFANLKLAINRLKIVTTYN
jgi:hypothetical protein